MFTKAQNAMWTKTTKATIEEINSVTFVVKIWKDDEVLNRRMFE